jgi:hypothetical protein
LAGIDDSSSKVPDVSLLHHDVERCSLISEGGVLATHLTFKLVLVSVRTFLVFV